MPVDPVMITLSFWKKVVLETLFKLLLTSMPGDLGIPSVQRMQAVKGHLHRRFRIWVLVRCGIEWNARIRWIGIMVGTGPRVS